MTTLACPSCGADVRFSSSLSISAVCPYCSTLVVRTDVDVKDMGKVAALPADMSPFQVGTEAYDGDTPFTLVGRVRLAWRDGFWTEWFFAAADGRKGWLAEAQGTFAISYESDAELHAGTRKTLQRLCDPRLKIGASNGQTLTFDGSPYVLTDRKEAVCVGCEGELPIVSPRGRKSLSFDFMGAPDEFASVDAGVGATDGQFRVFTGRYVEWEALRASGTREVEGWS